MFLEQEMWPERQRGRVYASGRALSFRQNELRVREMTLLLNETGAHSNARGLNLSMFKWILPSIVLTQNDMKSTLCILIFVLISLAHAGTPTTSCDQFNSLAEIKTCIESLSSPQRVNALMLSLKKIDALFKTDPTEWDDIHFTVSLIESSAAMGPADALTLYDQVEKLFDEQYLKARKSGKTLIFLGGEDHSNRSDLLFGLLLNHAAMKAGSKKYGFEVAQESYQYGPTSQHFFRGLKDELAFLLGNLNIFPTESEPLEQSYLEGIRHNREFELWHLLNHDPKIFTFAADPEFWNWSKYPNHFGYNLSREPKMVTTLLETALSEPTPVVAIYGRSHFEGISKLFTLTGANQFQLSLLNFSQTLEVYNTHFTDPLQKDRWIKNQESALYGIEHFFKSENHILLKKQGPQTAEAAYQLFQFVLKQRPLK